jgi:hypothetical protein
MRSCPCLKLTVHCYNTVVGIDISRGTADIFVSFGALTVPERDFDESPEFDSCHYQKPIDAS